MSPLGRKKIQIPAAKHHPKVRGKNVTGWWENIALDSNTSARMQIKLELLNYMRHDDYEAL